MSSAQSAPNPVSESSGTTLAQDTHESTMSIPQDADHISAQQLPSPNSRPEQALETHEVLELQTFIDRKAWIEDRIKVRMASLLLSLISSLIFRSSF